MAETTQSPSKSAGVTTTPPTPGNALETTRGTTTVADSVVTKVAGIAAREVAGIYALGGTGARAIGSVTQRVGIDTKSQGVSVEVDGRKASVEVTVVVEYGESIPQITQEVREQIVRRIEGLCGLQVSAVDITVADLHFAGDDESGEGDPS